MDLRITTDRLLLRPFAEADLDDFARINADPRTSRYLGDGAPIDRAATWRSIALFLGHIAMRGYGVLAVVERESGTLLGRSGPWFPEGWPDLEVGWVIDPARWGEGFATEAGGASLRWCWEVLDAPTVCSLIRPANAASIRVATKLGARLDRTVDGFLGGSAQIWVYRRPPR